MRIAITGSTGLIGAALIESLARDRHAVTRVIRPSTRPVPNGASERVRWDPARGEIDAAGLEGHDALIHLAGAPIGGRWTAARKRAILESRARGTRLLAETLARLKEPPRVLLSASAIGYYGYRDAAEALDESAPPGDAFVSEVVEEWERATAPARDAGIRVVNQRTAVVLSPRAGYLGVLLPLFRLGLGGRLGSGRQMLTWIALDEIPRVVAHLLAHSEIAGPVNVASPNPVTNAEFVRTLGRVLRRPAALPAPAFALRLAFGEFAGELLGGARVVPARLLASGYTFAYPDLEAALRAMLG